MKQRVFQPRKMDVGAFIESGEVLQGQTPVSDLARLCASLFEGMDPAALAPITWSAQGEIVPQRVGAPHLWLRLNASATLPYECQRCLHRVDLAVDVERRIRFVQDEKAAAELDADLDDDVLALSRQFNVIELVEDELIMAEPILPRHEECPVDLQAWMSPEEEATPEEAPQVEEPKRNPFAVLAALKKGQTGQDGGNN